MILLITTITIFVAICLLFIYVKVFLPLIIYLILKVINKINPNILKYKYFITYIQFLKGFIVILYLYILNYFNFIEQFIKFIKSIV